MNRDKSERRRYPKSTIGVVSNGRSSSHNSPRNSPRDSSSHNSPRSDSPKNSPSLLRSVLGTAESKEGGKRGEKRKSNDRDRDKDKSRTKKRDEKSEKKNSRKKKESPKNDYLREIRREVNLDTPSSSRSPLATISTTEEHHTDNESDDNQLNPIQPIQVQNNFGFGQNIFGGHHPTVTFQQLAEQSSDFTVSKIINISSEGDNGLTDTSHQGHSDDIMDMIPELEVKYEEDPDKSSDNLSDNEPEELEDDEIHYLSLQFLKQYSKGNSEWCQEFPEHGPSCRKCGQKGHTVIQCINPAKERCVFCGQYDHKHYNCPDSEQLEYKNFCIGCCYCGQSNHLGRNCPDHWRQFHRTTSSKFTSFNNTKNPKSPSCYNCAGTHWGYECRKRRIDSHGPVLAPFVTKRLTEHQSQIYDEVNTKIYRERKSGKVKKKRKRQ